MLYIVGKNRHQKPTNKNDIHKNMYRDGFNPQKKNTKIQTIFNLVSRFQLVQTSSFRNTENKKK